MTPGLRETDNTSWPCIAGRQVNYPSSELFFHEMEFDKLS